MNIVSKHVEESMNVLIDQVKELGFSEVRLWNYSGYKGCDWTLFADFNGTRIQENGSSFDEVFEAAKQFVKNHENAEVLLSL